MSADTINYVVAPGQKRGDHEGRMEGVMQGSHGSDIHLYLRHPDGSTQNWVSPVTGYWWLKGSSTVYTITGSLTVDGTDSSLLLWDASSADFATAGERHIVFEFGDKKCFDVEMIVRPDPAESNTPTAPTLPSFSTISQRVADLITLTGRPENSTGLGVFSSIITAGATIAGALAQLVTAISQKVTLREGDQSMTGVNRTVTNTSSGAGNGSIEIRSNQPGNLEWSFIKVDKGVAQIGFVVVGNGSMYIDFSSANPGRVYNGYNGAGMFYSEAPTLLVANTLIHKSYVDNAILGSDIYGPYVVPIGGRIDDATNYPDGSGCKGEIIADTYAFSGSNTKYASLAAFKTALHSYLTSSYSTYKSIQINELEATVTLIGTGDGSSLPKRIESVVPTAPALSWTSPTLTVTLADAMGTALDSSNTTWRISLVVLFGDSDDFLISSGFYPLGTNLNTVDWTVTNDTWEYPSTWGDSGQGADTLQGAFAGTLGGNIGITWADVATAVGGTANEAAHVIINLVSPMGAVSRTGLDIAST